MGVPMRPRRWKGRLHEGEPVEYAGPADGLGWPSPGDRGTLITPGEVGIRLRCGW